MTITDLIIIIALIVAIPCAFGGGMWIANRNARIRDMQRQIDELRAAKTQPAPSNSRVPYSTVEWAEEVMAHLVGAQRTLDRTREIVGAAVDCEQEEIERLKAGLSRLRNGK